MKKSSLFASLLRFKGNARGCVYTEPLWGIPYDLYAPFASLYMVALGLSDKQIGGLVSIGWAVQIVLSALSGVITDKLGRRLTTLIFDLLSWSVPAFISAIAQNYWYFLGATIIQACWRLTSNSWTCLLVEDTDEKDLLDVYSWLYIAGLAAAFFAPIAGLLVKAYTLVPTVRILYTFAGVMFTLKCFLTYHMTTETKRGLIRLEETRHQSLFAALGEYKGVIKIFFHSAPMLFTTVIYFMLGVTSAVNGTFWAIIVNEKLHIPAQNLAFFPFIRSIIMLLFFFVMVPRLRHLHFKVPMLVGLGGSIVSLLILITIPSGSYVGLIASIFVDACSFAAVSPQLDRMMVVNIDEQERARLQSIMYVVNLALASPFGWLAGILSESNKNLPFVMNIFFYAATAVVVWFAARASKAQSAAAVESIASALPSGIDKA